MDLAFLRADFRNRPVPGLLFQAVETFHSPVEGSPFPLEIDSVFPGIPTVECRSPMDCVETIRGFPGPARESPQTVLVGRSKTLVNSVNLGDDSPFHRDGLHRLRKVKTDGRDKMSSKSNGT